MSLLAAREEAVKRISTFMQGASVEILPSQHKYIPEMADKGLLPENMRVSITDMSGVVDGKIKDKGRGRSIECAKIVIGHGAVPIVHLAARRIESEDALRRIVGDLHLAGVKDVLALAGGIKEQTGPFSSSLDLLRTGLLAEFNSVGFAAHPQGNPMANVAATNNALLEKNEYAREHPEQDVYLISQLCYDPGVFLKWIEAIKAQGNVLPVHPGMGGPATLKQKFDHVVKCGISIGSIIKTTLSSPSSIRPMLDNIPDKFIARIAQNELAQDHGLIDAPHFFSFGQLEKALSFIKTLRSGRIEMSGNNKGFDLA